MSNTNKVAIVTGGANGIGWATASRLAEQQYRVAIVDLREDIASQRARSLGPGHIGIGVDVADEADVVRMIESVKAHFGRLDVLVNNAGIGEQAGPTVAQNTAAFDRLLNVHLRGTFLACREAAKVMLDQQAGAIVNLCSIAGLGGIPTRNAYGAAKAGIASMTRSMGCEWARDGIRVNAVAPGYVSTQLVAELERSGAMDVAAIKRRTPMGRLARPEEIADAICFLASAAASYITGTVLNVDGGWHAFGAPEQANL